MSILRQTYYLIRKNFQIKRRHKKLTLQEVIIPIYWVLILLVIKLTAKVKDLPAVPSDQIPSYKLSIQDGGGGNPGNTSVKPVVGIVTYNDSLAKDVFSVLKNLSSFRTTYKEFKSSDEMIDYYKTYGESMHFGMGIVFEKDKDAGGISYTLHMSQGIMPDLKVKTVNRGKCHNMKTALYNSFGCPANQYIASGIGSFQSFIDSAITQVLAGLPYIVVPNITVQMMPKRAYPQSIAGFNLTVPIYMVMAFAPYITILLVNLVTEKEKKYKEMLRIMGMKDTAYWLSWFLTYALIILLAVIIINAIAVPAGIFGNSNFLLMILVFYLYGLSLIQFAFMLTPLFKNSMTAGTVANLSTIVFGVLLIPLNQPGVPNFGKWIACLLSPTAFTLVLSQAIDTTGLQFSNLATKSEFPPSYAIIMIVVDNFLYLGLALYLDAVVPAEYGRRRPPYFLFMPSFWKSLFVGDKKGNDIGLTRQLSARQIHNMDDVEPVGPEMEGKVAISIHNVKKVFPGKEEVVAVDGFSMDIYEGQVTALLGHNGAGKSTLIAALTGMIEPTSGTALIYGKDITNAEDMDHIRRNIGVCPQQDVVFDFLTVEEHLDLYAGLKGVPNEQRKTMIESVIQDIDLKDKKDDLAKNLSGGQKRKLCVGISLIANPKVLFLDEPTSGMDPHSRRQMWSLLEEQAKDKVVLLTTHFMDEADILADYKAIMTKGKLRCAGSSLFLKNRFGIGYHLNMALSDESDSSTLENLVKSQVEGAELIRHHGRELAFSLPIDQVNSFAGLFSTLEDNNDSSETCAATRLGVTGYGVSMTTLEEVFLQLEDTSEDVKEDEHEPSMNGSQNLLVPTANTNMSGSQASNLHHTGVELNTEEIHKNEGMTKMAGQLLGLLKIQWLQSIRTPLKIFFMVVVPPILLIVGLVLIKVNSSDGGVNLERVPISPAMYVIPASTQSYATPILFQNSTGSTLNTLYGYLKDYGIDFDPVKSMDDYLNISSAVKPGRCLGLDAKNFPKNTSGYPKVNFLMRYNDTTVHSIPVGINIISSLFNMFALQTKSKNPHPIRTYFKPFPALKPTLKYDSNSFVSVLLIGLSFAVIPGGFAILVVAQRQLNIRHLLRVSGVSTFIYWLYLFISDAIVFIIPGIMLLILIPAIHIPSLSSAAAMGCLVIAVLLYIPSGILFSYCLSFLFSKWETCQQVLPSVFTYLSLIPFLVVSLVDMITSPDAAIIIHYVFSFLDPAYGLIGALYYVNRIHLFAVIAAQSNDVIIPASKYFTWSKHNGIPVAFIAMFLHVILFAILLYFLDTRNTGGGHKAKWCGSSSKHKVEGQPGKLTSQMSIRSDDITEDDVKEEKEKILRRDLTNKSSGGFAVAVKGLWKRFRKGKETNVVVKNLYFGVERGEVFGLLGPNGAGKTTTLNMVTGAIAPSRGQVTITGFDMNTESYEIFQRMGYCPQTDAVWDTLTLEEHLTLYAQIRGIPKQHVERTVQHYMSAMRVTEHAKKRAKDLSGGTRRKLSFQMAMLGGPELLLLDEPSTGLDPSARRFLWNTISKNVKGDRGAILTTHSMEEADALSSRVGIMVKGELKCLGSTQHLKSKYGSGYALEIKLTDHSPQAQTKLEGFVKELFPGAVLNEIFGGKATYKVPKENVSRLSLIFAKLEQGKQTIGIEEYSFSQSTLEQVFLEFAREQDDDRTGEKDKKKDELDELLPENPPHMV